VPKTVVQLGTVLDLSTVRGRARTLWEGSDVGGMLLCTSARGMDGAPGRAPLYLLRVDRRLNPDNPPGETAAADTYERWHERAPDGIAELDGLPDDLPHYIGRALRVGYRSDKWGKRGEVKDYDHDYTEPGYAPPGVWADDPDLSKARAILVRGGNQRVTEEGID
jgi:hypothetical protein